jgi:hypothetical protein
MRGAAVTKQVLGAGVQPGAIIVSEIPFAFDWLPTANAGSEAGGDVGGEKFASHAVPWAVTVVALESLATQGNRSASDEIGFDHRRTSI